MCYYDKDLVKVLGYHLHDKKRKYYDIIYSLWVGVQVVLCLRPLASPSMRGATPLDVAAASVMDNNELALALREPDLEKVSFLYTLLKAAVTTKIC